MNRYPLIKLEQSARLTDAEKRALTDVTREEVVVHAGADIVADGGRPHHSLVVLDGWVCRYKLLGGGRRQIMSFQLSGDWADLHSYFIRTMDHSLGAVTDCRIGMVPHPALRRLIEDHPRLGQLLWRDTMIDSAIFREWVVNLGARDARCRLAYLLCELRARLQSIGKADDGELELPLTQADLADSIGVSTVHLNRVLQELKREGLVDCGRGAVVITDGPGLERMVKFDPTYLHLAEGPPVGDPAQA